MDVSSAQCVNIRNFKVHYGGLPLRLLRPWGTRLQDNSVSSAKLKQIKISLYGNGVFSIYVSLQNWIHSTLFYFYATKAWSMTMVSFSCVDLTELRFTSQPVLESPVILTTKQNNTDKKFDLSTGRVFVQCDKSENTKLSVLIKYILNSSA